MAVFVSKIDLFGLRQAVEDPPHLEGAGCNTTYCMIHKSRSDQRDVKSMVLTRVFFVMVQVDVIKSYVRQEAPALSALPPPPTARKASWRKLAL